MVILTSIVSLIRKIADIAINEDDKTAIEENKARKNGKKPSGDKEHWYCAYCTYANTSNRKTCEMCTKPKKVLTNLSLLL